MELRAAIRLARVGLHLLWGALIISLAYPWAGAPIRRALKRHWSRQLVGMLGVSLKVGAGETAKLPPGLVVSNHISWLDIYVINALIPTAFVAKDDVRSWPLIGWLCTHTETIFIERGSRSAAQHTRSTIFTALRDGQHVSIFPEGTTTGGDRLLPFHAALFQSAIDASVPVVPLALRYVDASGNPTRTPAYDGDITLWQSLRAIVRARGLAAQIDILPPLATAATDRRHLSAHCHHAIAACLDRFRHSPVTPAS